MDTRSFDERFHLTRPGVFRALWRDARLLAMLGGIAWKNATLGRRVRRRYLDCKARGEPFWLDHPRGSNQSSKRGSNEGMHR